MKIYNMIEVYYTNKIKKNGITQGVDWNGEESQFLRFERLLKIIEINNFSISDVGCGYGKYFEFLQKKFDKFDYIGFDLSKKMIENAKKLYSNKGGKFLQIKFNNAIKKNDYLIANGIFNVKNNKESKWLFYILNTIEIMNEKSKKGFVVNILTKYSGKEYMKDYLYYADPLFLFDFCKKIFFKKCCVVI